MTIEVEVGNIVQVVDDRNLIVIDQGNTVEVAAVGAQGPTGPTGATGATGPQGPSGVISVTAPITNSGSSTSAVIGVDVGTTSATVAAGDRGLPAGGTAGQVLAKLSATNYDDAWIGQTAGTPLSIWWWMTPDAQTNFNLLAIDSQCHQYGFRDTGTRPTGSSASLTYKVALAAGTYRLAVTCIGGPDRADMTVSIGGVSVGVCPNYTGSVQRNRVTTFTGIVVGTTGIFDLELTNPTKNASSSGFRMDLQGLIIVRTA